MFKSNTVAQLPDCEVREQQIEEARRLASQEGGENLSSPRRTLHVSRTRPQTPRKGVTGPLKGHEAFLKALETSGAQIEVEKCDGTIITGAVIHSDKFTVSVRTFVPNPARPEGDLLRRDRVIFKHDISEFSAISPRPEVPDSKTEEGHAV